MMRSSPKDADNGADGTGNGAEDFDADALIGRLRRNAMRSLLGLGVLVAIVWRDPMAVAGTLMAGAFVLLNFLFLERLAKRLLGPGNPAPNAFQLVFLAFRFVLMALMLYGIFALPGVRPIPVALGLSVLIFAVVIESLSAVLPASSPRS